ncbi:hypothetical protein NIES2100_63410 [Calothrix sp. NIES-2100]|uniref:hypothetical protein n=1 Tax=Calothrix sp. NIES-2100 TaxID=1954172 RepID=UPI000B5E9FE7|nr:hypothetical protein NIES2100_63410 [Calothrix sp. NIES-2100]
MNKKNIINGVILQVTLEIKIHDFQLSLIWAETILDLLEENPPSSPLFFLGRDYEYKKQFEALKQNKEPLCLKLPWLGMNKELYLKLPWKDQKLAGQHFWVYYLFGKKGHIDINGEKAWQALVPFRCNVPVVVESPQCFGEKGYLKLESFFYPHGIALVVTARCRSQLPLDKAVDVAFQVRRGKTLEVEWNPGVSENLTLCTFAEKCFTAFRAGILQRKTQSVEPFTIFTVIRGEGVDPTTRLITDEVHRALQAVTEWNQDYKFAHLLGIDETKLAIRKISPDSHIIYERPRSRAIWFPALFTQPPETHVHSLSCYHNNFVFASLQVESLGSLVSVVAEDIRSGKKEFLNLPKHLRDCVKQAVVNLSLLYGGSYDTYRSSSPRVQLEQNSIIEDINEVRKALNWNPLS